MAGAEIVIRLVQYGAVLMLFGLGALPFHAGRAFSRPAAPILARALPPLGLAATLAALTWLTLDMAGDLSGLRDVALDMAAGQAMLVRAAVLAALLIPALARRPWAALGLSGIAAASLAFGGHAAGGEGTLGLLRLGADMLHLLAAGVWLGALIAFVTRAFEGMEAETFEALARFSGVGVGSVVVLAATGLANALWDSGGAPLAALATAWGRLLLLKLGLVGVMLALAALNRWRLVPALAQGGAPADRARLRLSLAAETLLGVAVLLLVSLLGQLSPLPDG